MREEGGRLHFSVGDGVGVVGSAEAKDDGGGDVDVDNMCADAATTQFRLIPIWPIAIYSSQESCTTWRSVSASSYSGVELDFSFVSFLAGYLRIMWESR